VPAVPLPLHPVANINDPAHAALRRMELDVVFVIGWSQILHWRRSAPPGSG